MLGLQAPAHVTRKGMGAKGMIVAKQAIGWVAVLVGTSIACSDHPLRAGMSEDEVIRAMGRPTLSYEGTSQVGDWFAESKECVPKLKRILLYDRYVRDDVLVGIGVDATVLCVDTTRGTAVTFGDRR